MSEIPKVLVPGAIAYSPELCDAFGICGGLLVQQIHYWCVTKGNLKDEKWWVYNTTKEWAEQLRNFDERTIKNNLKALREAGIVITGNYNKHGYDRTIWYRLDYDKIVTALQAVGCIVNPFHHAKGTGFTKQSATSSQTIPESNSETTTENTGPAPQPQTLQNQRQDKPEVAMLKKNKPPPKGAVRTTALAVSQQFGRDAATVKEVTATGMWLRWAKAVPEFHPEVKFIGAGTQKDKGMLGKIGKEWCDIGEVVLEYVIENWIKFGKEAKAQYELKDFPELPHLPFFIRHAALGMNMYLSREQEKKPVQLAAKALVQASTEQVAPAKRIGKITLKKGSGMGDNSASLLSDIGLGPANETPPLPPVVNEEDRPLTYEEIVAKGAFWKKKKA